MGNCFITIGREFGSGGHKIGQILSEKLEIAYYDNELLTLAAQRGELNREKFLKYDEKKHNAYLYESNYEGNENAKKGVSMQDALYWLQRDVILETAAQQEAVFVGRCADFILKEAGKETVSVFIAAPTEYRAARTMEREGLDKKAALSLIKKKDKARKSYYESRTGKKWGARESYDLYFDTGEQNFNDIAEQIIAEYRRRKAQMT